MFGRNSEQSYSFGGNDNDLSSNNSNFTTYYNNGSDGACAGPVFGDNPVGENYGIDTSARFGGGFLASQTANSMSNQTSLGGQTFLHMKISLINYVWLQNSLTSSYTLFDIPIEHIKIVGHILNVQQQGDNKYVFTIDDGTGIIPCDYIIADSPSPYRIDKLKTILEGGEKYVKIYGGINLLGKRVPHIRAHVIRQLENMNEIALHDIEVCYFASQHLMQLKDMKKLDFEGNFMKNNDEEEDVNTHINYKMGYSNDAQFQPNNNAYAQNNMQNIQNNMQNTYNQNSISNNINTSNNIQTGQSSNNFSIKSPSHSPQKQQFESNNNENISIQNIYEAISDILNEPPNVNKSEGLHISEIRDKCQSLLQQPNISYQKIRKALNRLEVDALVCTTIGPDNFASTTT